MELRGLANGLDIGDTLRTVCPLCGGGSSKERSLAVTREVDKALYICHRASCGARGVIWYTSARELLSQSTGAPNPAPKKQDVRPMELIDLPKDWSTYLQDRYYFEPEELTPYVVRYDLLSQRVAWSVLDKLGTRRGYVLRSYIGADPKSLLVLTDKINTSWHMNLHNHTPFPHPAAGRGVLLVVEDIPSAIRASKYVPTLALNGTNLSDIALDEVLSSNFKHITFALDADASEKAVHMARKYRVMFKSTKVLMLKQDIKDMKPRELQELMSG